MNNFLLSNFISNLKNGFKIKKSFIIIKRSNLIINILHILYKEGYIKGYKYLGLYNIKIFLKYYKDISVINNIKLISKPSKKIYLKSNLVLKKYNLNNLVLINTSKGLITNKDIFKNYINIYNNINYNFLIINYNFKIFNIELIFVNNKLNLTYFIKNLNIYNLLNRFYFYLVNKEYNFYINYSNIYNNYIKLNFFHFYKKMNNFFFKILNYKKNIKLYIAFFLLKYKKIINFKFLKKLNNLILIYNLNKMNNLIKLYNLKKLNLKKKKIKLNLNYNKFIIKKQNLGGEILLLLN